MPIFHTQTCIALHGDHLVDYLHFIGDLLETVHEFKHAHFLVLFVLLPVAITHLGYGLELFQFRLVSANL
jgi:hypothetical protein